MSDLDGLTCEQVKESAAELALGVLPAQERAVAVAHLEHCPECRAHVHRLTQVGDALLGLVPGSEPPAGFENRVLQRLGTAVPRPRRSRRRVAVLAAAAAAVVAVGMGGWAVGSYAAHPAPAASVAATPLLTASLTDGSHPMGQVFDYRGSSPWMYMSVDADGVAGTVHCQLERSDGSTFALGSFTLNSGYGAWGGPYPAGLDITRVHLLSSDGAVLATATLHRPQSAS